MPRQLQVTLAVAIVLPVVEKIRAQAQTLTDRGAEISAIERTQRESDLANVQVLLALFRPDFSKTGEVIIRTEDRCAILRACSYLRLDLRDNALAVFSDGNLEAGNINLEGCKGELKTDLTCYLFLATLQELILKHLGLPAGRVPNDNVMPAWRRWLRGLFGGKTEEKMAATPRAETLESWQVVVLNDPVNLMSYVTEVFHHVLGLSRGISAQRMREVHQEKRSILWQGPRAQVESCVAELRSWHLNAVAERIGAVPGPSAD